MSELNTPMEADERNDPKELDQNVNIVYEWLKKFESNSLTDSDFRNYWNIWVPHFWKPEDLVNSLDWSFDEQYVEKILFNTLEEFICNGINIKEFHGLTQQNYPSSVCGRVFKIGEPTYTCRECALDTTCVLCVDCFKRSSHKNHKYKMGASYNGGCCDCGEVEAWKKYPYCQIHKLGLEKKPINLNFLTNDMEKRAHLVFQYVLCYVRALLTFEHSPILPVELNSDEIVDDLYNIYKNQEDSFCMVLYNNETHTFDELRIIISRFISCLSSETVDYVKSIYREGRMVLKCASLIRCNKLKKDIETFTACYSGKPLRTVVVHSHVIAHQIYALRLLSWMKNLLGYSERIRTIFSDVVLAYTPTKYCIIEYMLRKDTVLWKSARLQWNKLIIAGMFKEYENKKEFSKVFIKNYGVLMYNFIHYEHDHSYYSYSVATFGVEIFNVPTLANYLIVHHNVLHQLLNIFLSECSNQVNGQGKFEFRHNTSIISFKRAQHILDDITFILRCVPETWNLQLRIPFCYAVSLILKILNYMQNMNTVIRQIGQHIEYEPEWETAFNLHLKLRSLITNIILWCKSDSIVFKRVYRMTLRKIWENPIFDPQRPTVIQELLNYKVSCIDYDVSTEPVSLHLPISRLLGELHLYLDHYGLRFDHPELQTSKQSPEQIIEPVLRTIVLISQVRAGMWKRNGYSLLNQIYLYHNSEYYTKMLDKDIVTLQMGASLIDSNEFLIHVLNKFNLLKWAQEECELDLNESEDECIHEIISLAEEFLTLIINIVGERYTLGVGKVTIDDCIKKEIIQQLCVKPMPHSKLNKTLSNIIKDDKCLDKVLNEVAELKFTGDKGSYELKPMYYDDYNVFFYHYSKEEMSKSEEQQRKRKKTAGDLDCCPPPSLPLFSDAYAKISNLMQCDVMFYLMKLILNRTVNLGNKYFSETQLHKVLHLIGYALHEQEKQQSPSFTFIKRSKSYDIEATLEKVNCSPRVEATKDLVTWTVQKFRQVAGARTNPEITDVFDNLEDVNINNLELEKQIRAKKAADRRYAVMAQFTEMQNKFIKDNIMSYENTVDHSESHNDSISKDILENISERSVALGPQQTTPSTFDDKYICILCQEEQLVTHESQTMVIASFVQKSSVLCQLRSGLDNINEHFSNQYFMPANFGPSPHISSCGHVMHVACWQKYIDMDFENVSSTLGSDVHLFEYTCPLCEGICNTVIPLLPPVSSLAKPKNRNIETLKFEYWLEGLNMAFKQCKVVKPKSAEKSTSEPTDNYEIQQDYEDTDDEDVEGDEEDDEDEVDEEDEKDEEIEEDNKKAIPPSNKFSIGINNYIMQILIVEKSLPKVVPKILVHKNRKLSTSLVDTILKFAHNTYSIATNDNNPGINNFSSPLLTWKACAYTIHSNEVILRYTNKPLLGKLSFRQKASLEALVRVSAIISSTWKEEHEIYIHALRFWSLTINNRGNNSIGILDWDAFGMLVSLTMTLPGLYYTEMPMPAPKGTMLDFHTLTLMFIVNLVQIILTIDIIEDSEEMLEMDPEKAEETFCLIYLVHKLRGINIKNTVAVWSLIEKCASPFLRCCCLFYHFLTGVPASVVLTNVDGDTFHNMCCYLGLPTTCKALLDKPYVEVLINKWAENEKLIKIRKGEKIKFKDWTHINELVKLPEDYSELLNNISTFTCPNSDRENSRNPTMCLVCGALLCSQNYCCRTVIYNNTATGACTDHASSCCSGIGVFLRLRECELFLLEALNHGSFILPPYLDEYGETDRGLKRGNPLYLCKDQYRKLQILWLSHGLFDEINRNVNSIYNQIHWDDM